MTLGHATCGPCAKITSKVELHVTRPIAGMLRQRWGIQTRKPKNRELIPKKLKFADGERIVKVRAQDFPSMLSYPMFGRPGVIEGRPREGSYRAADPPWSMGQDDSFIETAEAFNRKYGCIGFELARMQPALLMTFMAKVGHAAGIALLGQDSFTPLVARAAIFPNEVFDDFLGGGGAFRPNPEVLHSIEVRQVDGPRGELIFARLHWFACLTQGRDSTLTTYAEAGPPSFMAIIGRPVDDRFRNKIGHLTVRTNGDEVCEVQPMRAPDMYVPAPSLQRL